MNDAAQVLPLPPVRGREDVVNPDPAAGYDALGRKIPHRLNVLHFARAIPGLLRDFDRTVPDEFTFQPEDDVIEVACPCGQTPRIEALQAEECVCGRWFLFTGVKVIVNRQAVNSGS